MCSLARSSALNEVNAEQKYDYCATNGTYPVSAENVVLLFQISIKIRCEEVRWVRCVPRYSTFRCGPFVSDGGICPSTIDVEFACLTNHLKIIQFSVIHGLVNLCVQGSRPCTIAEAQRTRLSVLSDRNRLDYLIPLSPYFKFYQG